jgi:hypothetical protein
VPERGLFWDSSDEQEYAKEQDSSDHVLESDHSEINLKPAARKKQWYKSHDLKGMIPVRQERNPL